MQNASISDKKRPKISCNPFIYYSFEQKTGSITNRVGKYFFLASVPMLKGFMTEQKKTD